MRILHLAYEDPAQIGSGGGSVRTQEINKRLAAHHDITALVAGYPGARPRLKDGIKWVPLGLRSGGKLDRLSYFSLLGPAILRYPHDLVVEDFSAPFSVGGAPLFTRRPVVASVQWLFARNMREKYHLPFDMVEKVGLHLYNDFIAVSDWLAGRLREQLPAAKVATIYNGVDQLAFTVEAAPPRHLLFIGRLDIEQKGVDLLLESYKQAWTSLGDRLPNLIIAGDGPAKPVLEQQVQRLGFRRGMVNFVGRADGPAKYNLMAAAYAVLMPSRFETFGLVAAECLAVGTPLVAFNVGPLSEVAGNNLDLANLIPPFDLEAFARGIVDAVEQQSLLTPAARQARRDWASRYNWDKLAAQQEEHYLQAIRPSSKLFLGTFKQD